MKVFLILALITVFASVSIGQSQAETSKISEKIREVMHAQADAWNRGDLEGFMEGYWRSEELVFVSGTNVTRGWQPTLDRYRKSYDTKEKMGTLRFSDLEITVLSKNAAVVLGSWELTREKDNPKGKFTLTFRKIKDQWRIVMDHTS